MDCTSLTTIDLPKCATIENFAFDHCTNLTTIILSNNQVATLEDIYIYSAIVVFLEVQVIFTYQII